MLELRNPVLRIPQSVMSKHKPKTNKMKEVNFLNETKVRGFNEDVSKEIGDFENIMDFNLPPLYKLFYQTYDISTNFYTYPRSYLNPKFNKKSSIPINLKYEIGKINMPAFEYFMDLKISIQAYKNYSEFNLNEHKLLPIIKLSNEMIINVGYGSANLDDIILLESDSDNLFKKLGENIFHFLRGVILSDSQTSNTYNKLYLNWNEDFWRVRDSDTRE